MTSRLWLQGKQISFYLFVERLGSRMAEWADGKLRTVDPVERMHKVITLGKLERRWHQRRRQ